MGLDLLESEYTAAVGSIVDREFVRGIRRGRGRDRAHGDAAQAARRIPQPPGLRGHECHRHAQPARGSRRCRCRALRLHEHDERLRPGAHPACRGGLRRGSRRTWRRSPGTSTASRRRRPRISASLSIVTMGCPAWSCGRHASSRRPTICVKRCEETPTTTPTSKSTSSCIAESTSRTSASAHRLALEHAPALGFARDIVSATTPFTRDDLQELAMSAPSVVARLFP